MDTEAQAPDRDPLDRLHRALVERFNMKGGPWPLLISLALGTGLVIALLAGTNHLAQADATAVHYVAPGGTNDSDCSDPLFPCASVQYALSQAGSDDLIKVAGGTYAGVFTCS